MVDWGLRPIHYGSTDKCNFPVSPAMNQAFPPLDPLRLPMSPPVTTCHVVPLQDCNPEIT